MRSVGIIPLTIFVFLSGCSSEVTIVERRKEAVFHTEQDGIEVVFIRRPQMEFALPGERFDVYIYNGTGVALRLNYKTDEIYYYSGNTVYQAHVLVAGGTYPTFAPPWGNVRLGVFTDRKGLTISAFELRFLDGELKILIPKADRDN